MTGPGRPTQTVSLPAVVGAGPASAAQRAVFETLGSARAMRYLKPDPVPPEYVEALIWAGTRASSPDNTQPWHFLAVTDSSQRGAIARAVAPMRAVAEELLPAADESEARTLRGAGHLVENLADVPLLLFVCGPNSYPAQAPQERYLWSAVYPAAQNIVVAARALGLGCVFSMLHVIAPGQVRAILGIPAEIKIGVMLAIGWPARPSGPMHRRPLTEVAT